VLSSSSSSNSATDLSLPSKKSAYCWHPPTPYPHEPKPANKLSVHEDVIVLPNPDSAVEEKIEFANFPNAILHFAKMFHPHHKKLEAIESTIFMMPFDWIISQHDGQLISTRSYWCMQNRKIPKRYGCPKGWLLDDTMNAIGRRIHNKFPHVIVNSTLLYPQLDEGCICCSWFCCLMINGQKDFKNMELIFFPTNFARNVHWELIVIDIKNSIISSYNSLG
jgi:hypothetical protein